MMHSQQGSIMIVALLMLVLCSFLGMAAARTAEIEIQISHNYVLAKKAFYDAEGGISVARAVNFYRDDIPGEYTDDIEMYEDYDENGKLTYITVVSTGYAPSKSHPRRGVAIVEAGFQVETGWETDLISALYVGKDLFSNGAASVSSGSDPDRTTEDCRAWDVVSTGEASEDNEATNWNGQTGDPPELHDDEMPIAFDELFDHLLKWAEVVEASNNLTLGDEDSPRNVYQVVDSEGVKINNLDGYGILLVDGNLEAELGGNIGWSGIIMVRGNITFNGGGNKEIFGSVLASGDVTDNGGVDIYWDCAVMGMLKNKYTKYRMVWWKQ